MIYTFYSQWNTYNSSFVQSDGFYTSNKILHLEAEAFLGQTDMESHRCVLVLTQGLGSVGGGVVLTKLLSLHASMSTASLILRPALPPLKYFISSRINTLLIYYLHTLAGYC